MGLKERVLAGGLGGIAATPLLLSGMRQAWRRLGLVFQTAPMQVVDRLDEVGLLEGWSPGARRLLSLAAHFAYGMRTEPGRPSACCVEKRVGLWRKALWVRRLGCWLGARGGLSPPGGRLLGSAEQIT